jgi:hypothetical protein
MPRPSKKTPELVEDVLAKLSRGIPLAVICREDDKPCASIWRDWCDADENLAIAYARAREVGFDAIAVEALDIADDTWNDTRVTPEGNEVANSEWISRSRLRVETRLKLLAKWDPKRYGDRLALAGDSGAPLQVVVNKPGAD